MAGIEDKIIDNMNQEESVIPKDIPWENTYMTGRNERGVAFTGWREPESEKLYWKHPANQLLYSGSGEVAGYEGEGGKFHFNIPDFGPMETYDEAGNITSQRTTSRLESAILKDPNMGPISNKYLTKKEGQKYYGWDK